MPITTVAGHEFEPSERYGTPRDVRVYECTRCGRSVRTSMRSRAPTLEKIGQQPECSGVGGRGPTPPGETRNAFRRRYIAELRGEAEPPTFTQDTSAIPLGGTPMQMPKGSIFTRMEQLLADIQAGKPPSEETLKAAQASVDAGAKHEAEMAAMSPEEREKAIEEWATKLAAEVADLND